MSLKHVLLSGFAAALLSTTASAQDDTYVCNDRLCYDDQAEETRQLNLQQLENPGGDYAATDMYDYADDADADEMQGQGGPFFESEEEANQSGAMGADDGYDDDPYADDDMGVDDDDMAPPLDDDYDD